MNAGRPLLSGASYLNQSYLMVYAFAQPAHCYSHTMQLWLGDVCVHLGSIDPYGYEMKTEWNTQ